MSGSSDCAVTADTSTSGSAKHCRNQAALAKPDYDRGTLYTLALGTFAVGTEGFMIAAILPSIATSLGTSVQAAGQLVTIFALTYALSSPILTALTAAWPRRRLLMVSLAGFVVANLIAAAAPGYWWLAGARVLLAFAAGLYVPNANAVASALAPAAYRGRALAIVNGGITVAVALGVPAGALVGAHFGWRATFVGVAGLSAIALSVLGIRLPREIAASAPAGLRERLSVAVMPGVFSALLTTTLWATGAYVVYTYVSPFLVSAADLAPEQAGLVLTLLGICAIGGVTLGGHANDRFGTRRAQAVALPISALTFASLTMVALIWAPHALLAILPLVALWGLSAWSFFPPQQARLVGVAGLSHTPVVLSLNASFMYLGFSLGAILGSVVITLASVAWIGAAGAACMLCAIAVSAFAWRRDRT
ncbi:MFS transporter [Rhizobium calliandrae]|uniref:MFS transporter n=1 Tax=Rhizobium calliandrae TaxID=1312182 RepID=A0ABT7KFZ8_9HYPH|nr:MFS transporter [Rhizobium calliandrae]MDL2406908.1 MFS transporter [Rhizobium calliandrae]